MNVRITRVQPIAFVWAGTIMFLAYFAVIAAAKYAALGYNALDLGIFNQVFFNTVRGEWFASSIHPPSYLGDHFSPIIIAVLPLYAIARHPLTLVALQLLALGVIAPLLYATLVPKIGRRWAAGLAIAWLLNPFVGASALFEFSVLPFLALGLLVAYYGYDRNNFWLATLGMVCMALVREDAALAVIGFCLLAAMDRRAVRWWLAPLLIAVVGFGSAIAFTKFLMPDQAYKFLIYYSWLGNTPADALATLVTKPWLPILLLFRPQNWLFTAALALPLCAFPLARPRLLALAAVPALQFMLGSAGASLTVLQTQYANFFLVPAFLAAGQTVAWLQKEKPLKAFTPLTPWLLGVAVAYGAFTLGPLPALPGAIRNIATPDTRWELVSKIPDGAAVSAGYDFLVPLSSRRTITSFNYVFLDSKQFLQGEFRLPPDTEYILLDYRDFITYAVQYGANPFYQERYRTRITTWSKALEGFGAIAVRDTAVLLKKNPAPEETLWLITLESPTPHVQNGQPAGPGLLLLGHDYYDGWLELRWRAEFPVDQPIALKLMFKNAERTITRYYPWAYDTLYGNQVIAGTKLSGLLDIKTRYLLGNDAEVTPGDYEISATAVQILSGGVDLTRIGATKAVVDGERALGNPLALGTVTIQ